MTFQDRRDIRFRFTVAATTTITFLQVILHLLPTADPAEVDSAIRVQSILQSNARGFQSEQITELAGTITSVAKEHDLDPLFVLAIMRTESSFIRGRMSHAGALGLMQVMPSTGRQFAARADVPWHGPETLLSPEANVRIGVAYFAAMLDLFDGDVGLALAAYCHGPGVVRRFLRQQDNLPGRKLRYSRAVLATWKRYKNG